MAKNENTFTTKDITTIGLFAAVTFVVLQFLRFPTLPPPANFIHLGNVFLMLGALLMGPTKGTISASIAYTLFDLLHGYTESIPKVILTAIIKCIIVALLFKLLRKNIKQQWAIVISTIISFIFGILADYIYVIIETMLSGSTFSAAAIVRLQDEIPAVINAAVSIIIVPILYPVIKKIFVSTNNSVY